MGLDVSPILGDDALQNQWEIIIPGFPGVSNLASTNIRAISVDVPEQSIETYTVGYKTFNFEKMGGKIGTPREFTANFRIDKLWQVYNGFIRWKDFIANEATGEMSDDFTGGISKYRTNIQVIAQDNGAGGGVITNLGWNFRNAAPKSVSGFTFDYDGGDALTFSVTFSFTSMKNLGET